MIDRMFRQTRSTLDIYLLTLLICRQQGISFDFKYTDEHFEHRNASFFPLMYLCNYYQ